VGLSGERSERMDLSPMVREVLLRCAASCERALIDYREVAGSTVTGRELFGDSCERLPRRGPPLICSTKPTRVSNSLSSSPLRRAALPLCLADKPASMSRSYAVPPRVSAQPTKPSSC
jgi:hypothetical protein